MTPNTCNCGNCSGNETPNLTDFVNCNIRKDTVPFNPCCVMNPGAREYLMAPVIKELEEQPYNIMITRDEAIALIRDGVK